jgi:hypothetical protein
MDEARISPLLRSASDYLDAAAQRVAARGKVQHLAAGYGVQLLARLLDRVRGGLDEREFAEVTAVYDLLADEAVKAFGLPDTAAAFRALAELCDDPEAGRLLAAQPPAAPGHLRLLRDRVLWITVTYHGGERPGRECRIIYTGPGNGDPLAVHAFVDFPYEDLPARARARMIQTGQPTVRFELYSVAGQAAGPD